MNDIGQVLGWIAFFLLGLWRVYWYVSGRKAEAEKPRDAQTISLFDRRTLSKVLTLLAFGVVGVQLLGIILFPLPSFSLFWQIVGFILVVLGLGIAVIGRYNLGSNWANCYEYQVKSKQRLVTHGVYRYIRHPLYIGIVLFLIGSELIVQSYLVYIYLCSFFAATIQAIWEEQLLTRHFGDQYRSYMKRTKRFIPYLW